MSPRLQDVLDDETYEALSSGQKREVDDIEEFKEEMKRLNENPKFVQKKTIGERVKKFMSFRKYL